MPQRVLQQAINIAEDYLGPAAERFVHRQIQFHLKKDPTEITFDDIPLLAEWIKVSIATLTNDKKLVEEFSDRISGLSGVRK